MNTKQTLVLSGKVRGLKKGTQLTISARFQGESKPWHRQYTHVRKGHRFKIRVTPGDRTLNDIGTVTYRVRARGLASNKVRVLVRYVGEMDAWISYGNPVKGNAATVDVFHTLGTGRMTVQELVGSAWRTVAAAPDPAPVPDYATQFTVTPSTNDPVYRLVQAPSTRADVAILALPRAGSPTPRPLLIDGASATVVDKIASRDAIFTISGATGQSLFVQDANINSSGQFAVTAPDGQVFKRNIWSNLLTIPVMSGTYRIEVAGNATISVSSDKMPQLTVNGPAASVRAWPAGGGAKFRYETQRGQLLRLISTPACRFDPGGGNEEHDLASLSLYTSQSSGVVEGEAFCDSYPATLRLVGNLVNEPLVLDEPATSLGMTLPGQPGRFTLTAARDDYVAVRYGPILADIKYPGGATHGYSWQAFERLRVGEQIRGHLAPREDATGATVRACSSKLVNGTFDSDMIVDRASCPHRFVAIEFTAAAGEQLFAGPTAGAQAFSCTWTTLTLEPLISSGCADPEFPTAGRYRVYLTTGRVDSDTIGIRIVRR